MPKFAEVLVNKLKIYTYQIPQELEQAMQIGSEVVVPLRKQETTGYVLEFVPMPKFPTKDIIKLKRPEPVFNEALVKLAYWLAKYYRCYLPTALKTILPKLK